MSFTTRPTLRGYGGAVSAGHYLATQAGARVLAEGGNAADAACAMGFALQLLEPHMNGPAGEVPILVYRADEQRCYTLSGQGTAPAAATIERMRALGLDPRLPVMKALGVRELGRHLDGTLSLDDAIAQAQQATRNYAKRQLTWLRTQTAPDGPRAGTLNEQ